MKERTILSIRTIIVFFWLGFYISISFMEAPLKFTVHGLRMETGVAIGQVIFHALNKCELFFLLVLIATFCVKRSVTIGWHAVVLIVAIMFIETAWLLPALNDRAMQFMAGKSPSQNLHWLFIIQETVKIPILLRIGWRSLTLRDLIKKTDYEQTNALQYDRVTL